MRTARNQGPHADMSDEVGLSTYLFLVDSITPELSLGEVENCEIFSSFSKGASWLLPSINKIREKKIGRGAKSSWTTFLNYQIHCFQRHSNPTAFLVA